jgi:hypothetical protein
MTEAEWLTATKPVPMLEVLDTGADARKIRLFVLSCCRRVEYLLCADDVKRIRRTIAVLESWIEGSASESDLRAAMNDMGGEVYDAGASVHYPGDAAMYAISAAAAALWCVGRGNWTDLTICASEAIAYDALARSGNPDLERITAPWRELGIRFGGDDRWRSDEAAVQGLPEYVLALGIEQSNQAHLLRDIFGNPFRTVALSTDWCTETAVALARQMYASRDFSAMPILADALQDAGCTSDDILNHCRGPGPHVRGCWVVDLLLARG